MGLSIVIMIVAAATFALIGTLQAWQRVADLEDYMVSRNQVGGPMALATITASALGVWILFSPPEAASAFGGITAVLGYCLGSAVAVFLFVFVGPRLRQIMPWGHSLNEYVRHRFVPQNLAHPAATVQKNGLNAIFGRAMYWLTVGVMLFYMFVYLAAELTAIAQTLKIVSGVPLFLTSIVVLSAAILYTTYGGLKVTILTDALQFGLIVPLLLLCVSATVIFAGGPAQALAPVRAQLPELLSFTNLDGVRFGATLVIAVIAAELFNQGNWQRVYACRDDQTVQRAFLGSSLVVLPMILLSGLLGLVAAGSGVSGPTAFFDLLLSLDLPSWLPLAVILLAVALVMSSIDTLLSGISSVFTLDLLQLLNRSDSSDADSIDMQIDQGSTRRVLLISRLLTVAVGIPAVAIAAQGYSVLYLFFVADLICAALLFPIIFSLYSRYQTAANAFMSSLCGIAVGSLFFPKPDFSPLFAAVPGSGDLLNSFAIALLTSTAMTLLWHWLNKALYANRRLPFNYSQLRAIKPYTKGPVIASSQARP